ncbi:helix-turn-helix transcriptional regulator [Gynuella sunshinyii]|uniref:Response regulator containing a CheY-like receiver domain and an HTH DNA-binding domain n=1 Tax=Gynuella sunshinyii YC6258 TaxID=1445510 RepID=A0A0C5VHQ1_9GAMM|nr:helix-turn-helix transcriptional regulator [Gynuella sunshinyii]AJQ93756.1 response regulator containing a CheY-like receiver domain and an HTH DNA-binding domain [Gynuella sunshinyii YC6258]
MQSLHDNQLFADIYRGVISPGAWVETLDAIKDHMDVASVALQVFRRHDAGRCELIWGARDSFSLQHATLHDKWVNNSENPRLQLEVQSPLQILRDEDVFSSSCPQYNRFVERLACAGLNTGIMLDIEISDRTFLSLIAHRHRDDQRPYDQNIEQFLYALAPHLSQAVQLMQNFRQLSGQNKMFENVLNHLRAGIIVLDQYTNVIWLNDSARHLIAHSDALMLHNQQLHFAKPRDKSFFAGSMSEMLAMKAMHTRHITTINTTTSGPIEFMLAPVPELTNDDAEPGLKHLQHVAVYLRGQDQAPLNPTEVQHLYDLTPAESSIAVALAEGQTLAEYADQKGVSIGTARIQLKSIFSKMNINRQPELVRRLWSSVFASTVPPTY